MYMNPAILRNIKIAQQARDGDYPLHVIVGAFLHDIGHLVGIERHMERMYTHGLSGQKEGTTLGTRTHEKVGEKFLKNLGFPESVTSFVLGHIDAKRYLVYRYPEYHASLSRASQMTLIAQGGPMKQNEAEKFEKGDDFSALIQMRSGMNKQNIPTFPLKITSITLMLARVSSNLPCLNSDIYSPMIFIIFFASYHRWNK